MKTRTKQELNKLNKNFYALQAQSFSSTRESHWSGWEKMIEELNLREKSLRSVLDVGCGNGRFVQFLKDKDVQFNSYLGIDSSNELIKIASEKYEGDQNVEFKVTDILDKEQLKEIHEKYDLIVAFGLMHHIPEYDVRLGLLKDLVGMLGRDGKLVVTFWQFRKSKRFDKMILPADIFEFENDLEQGDYLLDWDKSGLPRYCHNFSDGEINRLQNNLSKAGIEVIIDYNADGKEGYLNKYLILSK